MLEEITKKIINQIKQKEEIQPLLFVWEDLLLVKEKVDIISSDICSYFWVSKFVIYELKNEWESIKIREIKEFISKRNIKSSFLFQIFIIENIQNLTLERSNSILKFLEEPWVWNVVFLTSKRESQIIDTILSRVRVINIQIDKKDIKNDFFYILIDKYFKNQDINLITYFYNDKEIKKEDYICFLETLFSYLLNKKNRFDILEDIEKALQNIIVNNVLPRYEIDKILLKL